MKNLTFVAFILFLASPVLASEEWFCMTQSSQMIGETFYSCGIGEAHKESYARDEADENAIAHFRAFCDISNKCKERRVAVEPARTSCEQSEPNTESLLYHNRRTYKCYKLVLFHMES